MKKSDATRALYEALLGSRSPISAQSQSVGSRSLLSLRVEKGYGSWGREYSPEYWPQEVGLERLIKLDKPEFVGREAYLAIKDKQPRERLVMLEIDVENADAVGGEPIFARDGSPVGRISSGTYGHYVEKSLGLAMIRTDALERDSAFDVAVLGRPHAARLLPQPPFDPAGDRLRG